ncbi:hypothetical protein [Nocardioides sp. 1609]|uniref:hypothetical protein n=1 Tax=Nocardioides sp. 1609 TaxID=2508327 RepID=UPI00106FC18E|nr:hypothetical protein [Nocardioides sp. 1609]
MTFDLLPTMTPWFAAFAAVAGLALVLTVVALGSLLRTADRPATSAAGRSVEATTSTRRLQVANGHVRHA